MSDRLLSRLADHLGLSESEVAPILKALLKQIRERAESGSGVQIPNLGTFSTDADGNVHFKPADALVEAVNEDYAGLEAEPAPEPARAPDTSTALVEPPPRPSASSSSSKEDDGPEDDSTEELPASSSSGREEADDGATKELSVAGESNTGADTSSGSGSLWPSEANAPTSPDNSKLEEDKSDDDTRDSDFWSRDREWDLSKVAFGDAPDEDEYEDESEPTSESASDTASPSSSPAPSKGAPEPSGDADAAPQGEAVPDDVSEDAAPRRKKWRTTAGILLVLAALIGGWIVLGQQGTVPAPSTVAERIQTSFSGDSPDVPSEPNDSAPGETTGETGATGIDSPEPSSSEDESDAPVTTSEDSAPDSPSEDGSEDGSEDAPSPSEDDLSIIPDEGGWTLVVASRTSESEAEELESIFANSLQEAGLPVDILPSESPEGTMRYRVVVGQFDSQSEARSIQQEYSDVVPDDAWALQL